MSGVDTYACVLFKGKHTKVQGHSRGIYSPEDVNKLYRGICRHSTKDIRFVCITDFDSGFSKEIETVPFLLPYRNYFSLLEIHRPELQLGTVMFTGLDTIFVGQLDDILSYTGEYGLITNYPKERLNKAWQSVYHRIELCNGLLIANAATSNHLWSTYSDDPEYWQSSTVLPEHELGSEMCFLYEQAPCKVDALDMCYPGKILSYKRHIANTSLWSYSGDCDWDLSNPSIVYFSGSSKPHNAPAYLKENWI